MLAAHNVAIILNVSRCLKHNQNFKQHWGKSIFIFLHKRKKTKPKKEKKTIKPQPKPKRKTNKTPKKPPKSPHNIEFVMVVKCQEDYKEVLLVQTEILPGLQDRIMYPCVFLSGMFLHHELGQNFKFMMKSKLC